MSVAQAQELYDIFLKIDAILNGINLKVTQLNTDQTKTKETLATFRQLERLALRWLVLARQMGLPPEFSQAMNFISRMIVIIRMWQMSVSLIMATNPVTALIGVAGLVGTAVSAASMGSSLEGY